MSVKRYLLLLRRLECLETSSLSVEPNTGHYEPSTLHDSPYAVASRLYQVHLVKNASGTEPHAFYLTKQESIRRNKVKIK